MREDGMRVVVEDATTTAAATAVVEVEVEVAATTTAATTIVATKSRFVSDSNAVFWIRFDPARPSPSCQPRPPLLRYIMLCM